jgi:hypothetical protein
MGSEHPFIGPEPACSISVGVAKKAVRDWANINHKKHWESVTRLRQAKGLILGPSARRTKDLLKLNRDELRWIVGQFTGHLHLFKLGLTDPICKRCLAEDESATHILCDCGAIAYLRFRHMGQFFMEPSTTMTSHKQSPTFHSKCRINKGLIKRRSTTDH